MTFGDLLARYRGKTGLTQAELANRLGMTRMRAQLEDLAMRYLYPTAYMRLAKKMAVRQQTDQHTVVDSGARMGHLSTSRPSMARAT